MRSARRTPTGSSCLPIGRPLAASGRCSPPGRRSGGRLRRQDDGVRRAGGQECRRRARRAGRRRAARASLQRRACRRRDAGLALRAGAARCRRGGVPQSGRSRAPEEARARSRRIAGYHRAGRRRRSPRTAGAAVAGDRPGPRVPHDRQPRAPPRRHGVLRGGDGTAPARADLALPIRQPAGGGFRRHHCRRAGTASPMSNTSARRSIIPPRSSSATSSSIPLAPRACRSRCCRR